MMACREQGCREQGSQGMEWERELGPLSLQPGCWTMAAASQVTSSTWTPASRRSSWRLQGNSWPPWCHRVFTRGRSSPAGLWESSAHAGEGDAQDGVVAGDGPCPFPTSCPLLGQPSPVSSGQPQPGLWVQPFSAVPETPVASSRECLVPVVHSQQCGSATATGEERYREGSAGVLRMWQAGWGNLHSFLFVVEDPTGV